MHNIQGLIFQRAANLPESAALVLLALGLLCTMQGFRFARFLIAVACAAGGFVVGAMLSAKLGLPHETAGVTAVALCILAVVRYRAGLVVAAALTIAALACFLASQLGARPNTVLISAVVGLAAGFSLIWVCPRDLPILLTILHGAGLLIAAFVGLTSALAPSLGATFRAWAGSHALMTPGFMLMLCALGYSAQANARQGDMETGGSGAVGELERPA